MTLAPSTTGQSDARVSRSSRREERSTKSSGDVPAHRFGSVDENTVLRVSDLANTTVGEFTATGTVARKFDHTFVP